MTETRSDKIEYQHELTRHLASIMRLWMSPGFREALMGMSDSGCNETDARVVWELAHKAPRRPGGIAEDLSLGAAAITKSIARLTSLGLVEAVSDPTDQRARLVNLTPSGRQLASELFHVGDVMVDSITRGWSKEEVDLLTTLMSRFSAATVRFYDEISSQSSRPRQNEADPQG